MQIGFKITEYNSLRRPGWYLVEYPYQGGFSEDGHWPHFRGFMINLV